MPILMPASPGFVTCRFELEFNTQTFTSPLSRVTQVVALAGARWKATYTLPRMSRAQAAPWRAFLLSLEGQANTFAAYDPDFVSPLGTPLGAPLVKGAGQTGSTLLIDGCVANVTGWLKAGDYFSVGGKLKMITADASTNGSGEATLTFKPANFAAPADNAPLTVYAATCEMRLVDDSQGGWETDPNRITEGITFSAVEAL